MGKSFAPALANIYLAPLDHQAIHHQPVLPLLYTRYIDDIFFVWTGDISSLNHFQNFLNSLIPGIKLTFTHSHTSIDFLDLTVYIEDLTLYTKTYFKPTDRHALLSYKSFHPRHTFKGILKSQFIRYKSLSCFQIDFIHACHTLINSLTNRGYTHRQMTRLANQVWFHDVNSHTTDHTTQTAICPLTLQYNNTNQAIASQIKSIIKNSTHSNIHIITSWQTNRNLAAILRGKL